MLLFSFLVFFYETKACSKSAYHVLIDNKIIVIVVVLTAKRAISRLSAMYRQLRDVKDLQRAGFVRDSASYCQFSQIVVTFQLTKPAEVTRVRG